MAISKITGSALDKDVIMKDVATADGSSPTLTLQTGDTDIAADDVLGSINFQAPDEGAGTDAILVAAGIAAVSEGDFSSSNNATKLSFRTGASETATEKMSLSSGGTLTIISDATGTLLNLVSTEAGANNAPRFDITRNSASPAAGDNLGQIRFMGEDAADNSLSYVSMYAVLLDPTDSGEDGSFELDVRLAGSNRSRMISNATETVFNDDTVDLDFRVESDNQTHALFVQGSDGFVGINEASPTAPLSIQAADNADLLRFTVTGNETWAFKGASAVGSNDTVSFGIAGGTQAMAWDENGICTKPAQPAFSCILGAGNQGSLAVSTLHTVLFTEVYDQNADFASNTFTAPVTGKYQLQSNLYINAMDDATSFFQLMLVTSNRTYYAIIDPRAFDSDPGQCSLQIAVLADMDASDTAVVKLQLGSGGSAQSSIYNNSNFSGFLAC